MKEIGGYLELEHYRQPMLHEGAIALNCARNCLAYLLEAKKIQHILLPKFLCNSVRDVCKALGVQIRYYAVGTDLLPLKLNALPDEWLYLVNYYGQLSNSQIEKAASQYPHIIVDNVQAYFQKPVAGIDTLYTCRKFFGVPDGAFLYTDARLGRSLPLDESFQRMEHLLGRFEKNASDYYGCYVKNEEAFIGTPIRQMSRLTANLLHGIDYNQIRQIRTENFAFLHEKFKNRNQLMLQVPEGPFMYPLWIKHGAALRQELQAKKIYIPTLWPDVFDLCRENELEYMMAQDILPLPVDQRYTASDMAGLAAAIDELAP